MESNVVDTRVFGSPTAIAGHETRLLDRMSGLVIRMKSLRLPNFAASSWFRLAAEGATDKELEAMPAHSANRALETAKANAYKYAGYGLN